MIPDLLRGFSYFVRGTTLILRRRIRPWAITPIFLTFLVYAGALWWGVEILDGELGNMRKFLPGWIQSSLEWIAGWMPDWLEWALIWLPVGLLIYFIFSLTFVAVAALVASPFNGPLAEAVEMRLGGKTPQVSVKELMKRLPGIAVQESKKIVYYLLWAVPFGMASLVMLIFFAPLAPVPWLVFSAWMLALEFSDFPMDNNELLFREMRRRLRAHKWLYLGFGGTALLASTVPILSLIVVPAGVAGATAIWHDVTRHTPAPPQR